jgi:hypothetical protein
MGTPAEPIVPESTTEETPGINPAWAEALSSIPAEFHNQLTPHFQKWDQSAQGRIEELNSKLTGFEAYSPLVEHGIGIDQISDGLRIMQELNSNPKSIWDALTEAYGFTKEQVQAIAEGQNPTEVGTPPNTGLDLSQLPEYRTMKEQLDLVSQLMVQEQQNKANALEDAKLDKALGDALAKFPDVEMSPTTENFILSQMEHKGKTAEQAVQDFVDFRNSLSPQPFAPKIVGSGGGVPSQAINASQLNDKDTKALIVQMLKAQNGQS